MTEVIVSALRRELLVAPDLEVTNAHLETMFLEFDWQDTRTHRVEKATHRRSRTLVRICVVTSGLTLTGGLSAAGALPAPAQHWLSVATRMVGIHLPDSGGHTKHVTHVKAMPRVRPEPARKTHTALPNTRHGAAAAAALQLLARSQNAVALPAWPGVRVGSASKSEQPVAKTTQGSPPLTPPGQIRNAGANPANANAAGKAKGKSSVVRVTGKPNVANKGKVASAATTAVSASGRGGSRADKANARAPEGPPKRVAQQRKPK